ncbi:hypothetical protein D3C75_1118850 [compost metagenome]
MLDIEFPRGTVEVAVAQAVKRFAEACGGEYFRAARQFLSRRVLQHKEVIFRAGALHVLFERRAGVENLVAQAFAVVRQGRDAHQAFAGQSLQLGQVG